MRGPFLMHGSFRIKLCRIAMPPCAKIHEISPFWPFRMILSSNDRLKRFFFRLMDYGNISEFDEDESIPGIKFPQHS